MTLSDDARARIIALLEDCPTFSVMPTGDATYRVVFDLSGAFIPSRFLALISDRD